MKNLNELIKIANEIANVIKGLKEVKAIAVGGGIVSGYPDEYSDVDIYCLSTKLPNIKNRTVLLKKLELERIKVQYNNSRFAFGQDLFFYKGKAIGVDYIEIPHINKKVNRIRSRGNISRDDALIVNKFIYHKPIWDPNKIFYKYKKELKKYTKKLRHIARFLWSKVEEFTKVSDWPGGGGIHTAIKRKNYIWVAQLMNIRIRDYIFCLYTLNNAYYHEGLAKWAFKRIKDFKYKPKNCVERLEKISILGNKGKELNQKLKIFEQLIKDTSPLMKKL